MRVALLSILDHAGEAEDGRLEISVSTHEAVSDLNRITAWAIAQGIDIQQLEVRRPSLEDVYLELTDA